MIIAIFFFLSHIIPFPLEAAFEIRALSSEIQGSNESNFVTGEAFCLNPAILNGVKKIEVNYTSLFSLPHLKLQGISVNFPLKKLNLGLAFNTYGNNFYREESLYFGLSKKLWNRAALGINLKYLKLKIVNAGEAQGVAIDIGAVGQILKELKWGLSLFSINTPVVGEEIPLRIAAGISWRAAPSLWLSMSWFENVFAFGGELLVSRRFLIRAGCKPSERSVGVGFGIIFPIRLNFSFIKVKTLPLSYGISISYTC